MSKWDKLLARIYSLSKDLRFEELRETLINSMFNAPIVLF